MRVQEPASIEHAASALPEQNDAVWPERVPGLQTDLNNEVPGLGSLPEGGMPLCQFPVGLQVTTTLVT